jgi:hypothetical protein
MKYVLSLLLHIVYLNSRIESTPGNKRLTFYGVTLDVIPMSLLCPLKNEVAFKITIGLVID